MQTRKGFHIYGQQAFVRNNIYIYILKKQRFCVKNWNRKEMFAIFSSFKLGGDDLWWYSESEQLNIYRSCFFFCK
jgi:hypothetical protein